MSDAAPFFCLPCDVLDGLLLALTRRETEQAGQLCKLPELSPKEVADAFLLFALIVAESHRAKPNYFLEIINGDAVHTVRRQVIGKTDYLYQAWSPERITTALRHLDARGFTGRHSASGKEWLTVTEPYRHVPLKQGKPPPRAAAHAPPEQPTLGLDGGLAVLPSPAEARSRIRIEEKPESDSAPHAVRKSVPARESGNRLSGEGEGERFARTEEDNAASDWPMMMQAIGLVELNKWGELWLKRAKQNRAALFEAASDYHALNPSERAAVKNRGAWMTERFEHHARATKATA